MKRTITLLQGLTALSPLVVFLTLYLLLSLVANDFYAVPIIVAFLFACLYAVIIQRGTAEERFSILIDGATSPGLMQMVWIFILAGAFAATAKQMGAVDATVSLTLTCLPNSVLLCGLFVASCFISLSTGTSVGTISALAPIALSMAERTGLDTAFMTAVVVGGAYFGDNLSFISDTTIMATQTQGCRMKDKFRANIWIAMPAAIACMAIYLILNPALTVDGVASDINWLLVLPYLYIIGAACLGMNVLLVLTSGTLLAGIIGLWEGKFDLFGWLHAMNDGVMGMSELIIVTILAAALVQSITKAGGITFLMERLTNHVRSRKGAELSMGILVVLTDFCTANNTIAILTVGPLAREMSVHYGIRPQRAASILDTFSCMAQGIIPYGAQMLIACSLTKLNPIEVIPHLYYPYILGISALTSIFIHHEKNLHHQSDPAAC